MVLYKHKNNTDVAFRIIEQSVHENEEGIRLIVEWWNVMGVYYIIGRDSIFIKFRDIPKWEEIK